MKTIKLTNEDLGTLCKGIACLIHAGIGAGDALALMAEDEKDPACRQMLLDMARRADDGAPLAVVFRAMGTFPAYICALLEVGERVGKLEEALTALAVFYDGRARMDRRLRAALLYPSLLLIVLLAVVVVLLVWVLPVFDDVYAQLGSSLTGLAGGLLSFGDTLRRLMPVLGAILLAVVILVVLVAAWPDFRKKCMAIWRKCRGDKGVTRAIHTARFAQALAMGLSSGLTPEEAVQLATTLAEGTESFRRRCENCLQEMEQGKSLPAALRESALLPRSECRLLEAGMRGGSGEHMMEEVAQRLLEESELELEAKVGRIEPALVIVTCIMVGVILLSVMLPLMHIMTTIG